MPELPEIDAMIDRVDAAQAAHEASLAQLEAAAAPVEYHQIPTSVGLQPSPAGGLDLTFDDEIFAWPMQADGPRLAESEDERFSVVWVPVLIERPYAELLAELGMEDG